MNQALLALIAVLCNVGAQISIKGAGDAVERIGGLIGWLNPWLALAVLLYGASFLLTVKVFAVNPLTVAAPIMAGGAFVLTAISGSLLLGESLGLSRIAGMVLILGGILLITRSS